MDQTQNHQKVTNNSLNINFDILDKIENDDFLDLEFKPLNKGLGFHNEQKRVSNIAKSSVPTKQQPAERSKDSLSNFYSQSRASQEVSVESVNHFYKEKEKAPVKKIEIKPRIVDAQMHICFFAWLVDVAIITLTFSITVLGFVIFSGIDLGLIKTLVSPEELMLFAAFIYTGFYLLYFTLLDLVSTPGNALFGIKLLKSDNSAVRAPETFLRGILTFMIMLTGLVTYFINFQNKLSDTKLIQS